MDGIDQAPVVLQSCRCKLAVASVQQFYSQGKPYPGVTFKFTAEYDEQILEDLRFQRATPTAEFTMLVDNPAAIDFLKSGGGKFYVDFTRA